MTYSETLVMRLASICKKRGIAYNKLAKMCGVPQSTIDNIVRGVTKNPRVETMQRIANGLNMTLAEFFDYPELNAFSFEDEK